jgi:hypothetical protein
MSFFYYKVRWWFESKILTDTGLVIGEDFDDATKNIMRNFDEIDSIQIFSLNWDYSDILPLPNDFMKAFLEAADRAIEGEGVGIEEEDKKDAIM